MAFFEQVKIEDTNGNAISSNGSGALKIDGTATVQPISATSLPLPTGASTSASQTTGNTSLASIDSKTPALASGRVPVDGSGVTQPVNGTVAVSSVTGNVTVIQPTGSSLHVDVDNFPATQAISAVSLPLPTGAATSTNQSTGNTSLASIDTKTPALSSGRVPVDGSGVTQPVSGTPSPSSNDAPTGTETAQIIRNMPRKRQTLLSTATLLANAVFTSGWFDSEVTGCRYVTATSVSNVNGAATIGLQIQESEDQTNTFSVDNIGGALSMTAGGTIKRRYWRVVYTNGASNQTSFSLYTTESPDAAYPVNNLVSTVAATAVGGAGAFADSITNASSSLFLTSTGGGGTQRVASFLYNGSTWDRPRGNVDTTTGDTGAKTATFNGATQTNYNARGAYITIELGTVSGTLPTLSLQLQWSPDSGTTWLNLGAAVTNLISSSQTATILIYPAITATTLGASQSLILSVPLPRTWRLLYTIGGTTPSFTIATVGVNYIN